MLAHLLQFNLLPRAGKGQGLCIRGKGGLKSINKKAEGEKEGRVWRKIII